MRTLRRLSGAAVLTACAFAIGCGGSGTERQHFSGEAHFNGRPVPLDDLLHSCSMQAMNAFGCSQKNARCPALTIR